MVQPCFQVFPPNSNQSTPEQRQTIDKLLEKLEEDEDVQNVFHNMKEDDAEDAE